MYNSNYFFCCLFFFFSCDVQLPTIIADNAGYDSSELIAQLRALHADGKSNAGLGKYLVHKKI